MDLIANLATGFAVSLTPANLGFCFLRRADRYAGWCAARHRADYHHRDPAAVHLLAAAEFVADHARRYFLRCAICGSTTAILVQCAGVSPRPSSLVWMDTRWPSRARAGQGAGHRRDCVLCRRHHCDHRHRHRQRTADLAGAQIQRRRIFQPDGARPLTGSVVLAHGAPEKAIAMVLVGLLLGLVGIDPSTAARRA